MGSTLDQYRAAIGSFAARQISPTWTPSSCSSSSSVCHQSFESSGEAGGKKRSRGGQLVQLVLLVSIFYSGSLSAPPLHASVENTPFDRCDENNQSNMTTFGSPEQLNMAISELCNLSAKSPNPGKMPTFETSTAIATNGHQVCF